MEMGNAPRVSVLLPIGAEFGRSSSAAASVLGQTGVDLELLVLHDGSAPDEAASLAAQAPDRVRVLAHPPQGVARALALGAAVGRGEWLVGLGCHEVWLPETMAGQLAIASADPALVGVLSLAAGGAVSGRPADLPGVLFADVVPPGGGALLRTTAVRAAGGFDPSLRFSHHLDLWLRLLETGALVVSPTSVVNEPSRAREPGEPEAEASRWERAHVLDRALATLHPEDFTGSSTGGGERELEVARAVVRTGLLELRAHAVELVFAACAAGAAIDVSADPDLSVLLPEAPALAHVVSSPVGRVQARDEPWLRVALEVQSLDRGGLENVVAELALGFGAVGIDPVVVCTERGGARAAELRAVGIDVVVLRAGDRVRELGDVLDSRRVDLLNPHFSMIGVRPAVARGIPVVPTLHNAYGWVGASVVDEFRALDPLVNGYTAVSQFVADFTAARFGIDQRRLCVIPNAYRAGGAGRAMDRGTARRELDLPEDAALVLQVGRIDPIKCQLALVDAVCRLGPQRPGLRAWIAGGIGDPSYAARVEERIARSGAAGAVTLLGERDDVGRLLAAADVLAMPSVLEGLSLSVIEALAAGVPAVLTRTGDAARLLGDGAPDGLPGALIDGPVVDPVQIEGEELFRVAAADHPAHAAALAQALGDVLDDLPAMQQRARRRGAELSEAFAPADILSRYAAAFGRTVATHGRAAAARASVRTDLRGARETKATASRAHLRSAVADSSEGLGATLHLAREREQALRQAGSLTYELGALRGEIDATAGSVDQLLNKLRLTHRLRGAVASVRRRLLGG
ncbi:MAG: glycosyltransferase [Candidatus Binatia bacterium]|nr:glycosyltransferase [Candidatus Binatia bacterium]